MEAQTSVAPSQTTMPQRSQTLPRTLVDRFGRVVRDVRISVTPRCNLRCTYCDPLGAAHAEPAGILSVQDVAHFLRAAASLGMDAVRFTGGEPLLRKELPDMIAHARETPGVRDVAITTNGSLFRRRHRELMDSGLKRINLSLDALDPGVFARMTNGGDVRTVLDAVDLALSLPLAPLKLNAVTVRDMNDSEWTRLAGLSIDRPLHVRFIEYMHLNNEAPDRYARAFVPGREVKARIEQMLGPLSPVATEPSSPARVFRLESSLGTVGFINSVSEPFCAHCSRMRLTADRKLRPCLMTDREVDATAAFRSEDPTAQLVGVLLEAARRKDAMGDMLPTLRDRTMVRIGG